MSVFWAVFGHSSYLSPGDGGWKHTHLLNFKIKNTIVLIILRGMGFSIPCNSIYLLVCANA